MPNYGSILAPNNDYNNRQYYRSNDSRLPDLTDLPIRFPGHPKYNAKEIIITDPVEMILQKLELLLYTKTGEVLGEPDFGANLEYYLWSTQVATSVIEDAISRQITKFIPELDAMGYNIEVYLVEGELRDIMYVDFLIKGQNYLYLWA